MGERCLMEIAAELHVQEVKNAAARKEHGESVGSFVSTGSCVTGSAASSLASTESAVQLPGLRRDISEHLREVRKLCQGDKDKLKGAHREDFEHILARKDEERLMQFMRLTSRPDAKKGECRWCNVRVAVEANPKDSTQPMRCCQICAWQFCPTHCSTVVDMCEVWDLEARPGFVLVCCDACHHYIGKLLWRKNTPPQGLSSLAAELFRHFQEIHAAKMSLLPALDSFEEHIGNLEMTTSAEKEVIEGVRIRCDRLEQQVGMIASAASSLEQLTSLVPRNGPQAVVHAALLRYANSVLLDTQTRVTVTTMRGRKWQEKARRNAK
mmetsp:Transcript_9708/g.22154  ORF Transcript_9708/g.22154 Transcript_9708/m.22154 type:complete len:324 (-) Transcript_9708:1-972(-)